MSHHSNATFLSATHFPPPAPRAHKALPSALIGLLRRLTRIHIDYSPECFVDMMPYLDNVKTLKFGDDGYPPVALPTRLGQNSFRLLEKFDSRSTPSPLVIILESTRIPNLVTLRLHHHPYKEFARVLPSLLFSTTTIFSSPPPTETTSRTPSLSPPSPISTSAAGPHLSSSPPSPELSNSSTSASMPISAPLGAPSRKTFRPRTRY